MKEALEEAGATPEEAEEIMAEEKEWEEQMEENQEVRDGFNWFGCGLCGLWWGA